MRTTVRLDENLLREAKGYAAATGRTLTAVIEAVIEDALREALARRHKSSERSCFRLRTFKGTGLQPGIDLDDSAALWDLVDGTR
jgi:hypothetical protein